MRLALIAASLLAFAAVAHADKVKLDIKVVEASAEGSAVDPKLKHMEDDFRRKNFNFKSYKLLSESSPVLDTASKQSADVPLPNGKTVKLTAVGMVNMPMPVAKSQKGVTMHVSIPNMAELDYQATNHSTSYQGAGEVQRGASKNQIFLVIHHTLQ